MANLADVAARYLAIGISVLLIADVIEDEAGRSALARAVAPATLQVVRLDIAPDRLEKRLRSRESEQTIGWYLERGPALQDEQRAAGVEDLTIRVVDESPDDVADLILRELGLLAVGA